MQDAQQQARDPRKTQFVIFCLLTIVQMLTTVDQTSGKGFGVTPVNVSIFLRNQMTGMEYFEACCKLFGVGATRIRPPRNEVCGVAVVLRTFVQPVRLQSLQRFLVVPICG